MNDLIDQLAIAIADRVVPQIPVSIDLWSSKECAAYLKVSPRTFLESYACKPGFPAAIRLPSRGTHKGMPRWKAVEVIKWVEKFTDRRAS